MMFTSPLSLAKILMFLLPLTSLLWACGEDEPEPDGDQDQDRHEYADFNTDGDEEASLDKLMFGNWMLQDTSAIHWYNEVKGLSALYLKTTETEFLFWMEKNYAFSECLKIPVTRKEVTRFVPTDDKESCYFELSATQAQTMTLSSRHKDDTSDKPWAFEFTRLEWIPDFDENRCTAHPDCINFNE